MFRFFPSSLSGNTGGNPGGTGRKWGYQTRWDSSDILECPSHFCSIHQISSYYPGCSTNVPRPQSPPDLALSTALEGIYVLSIDFPAGVHFNHTDRTSDSSSGQDKRRLSLEIGKELEVMEQTRFGACHATAAGMCPQDPIRHAQASESGGAGQAQSQLRAAVSRFGQPANLERLGDRPCLLSASRII